jgi:hypothetical protein
VLIEVVEAIREALKYPFKKLRGSSYILFLDNRQTHARTAKSLKQFYDRCA